MPGGAAVTPPSAGFGSRRSAAAGRAGLHPDTAPTSTKSTCGSAAAGPYVVTVPGGLEQNLSRTVRSTRLLSRPRESMIATARSVTRRCLITLSYALMPPLFQPGARTSGTHRHGRSRPVPRGPSRARPRLLRKCVSAVEVSQVQPRGSRFAATPLASPWGSARRSSPPPRSLPGA